MSTLLSVRDISKGFTVEPLFEGLSVSVASGDRLAVIGPNGSGKSTLLAIMAGALAPDGGERTLRGGTVLAHVRQAEAFAAEATVASALAAELGHLPEHERAATVARLLALGGFADADQAVAALSGGWRKRLAICAALALEPEVLLLDEPTNHLDLPGVLWLEDLLRSGRWTCVVISHDRWFLDRIATRVVEINPRFVGGCFNAGGDYQQFLQLRAEHVAGLQQQQESLANKHRREQEWLARQPKARTTKNAARIREAHALGAELEAVSRLNTTERKAGIAFNASERRTQDLIVAEGIAVERGGRQLFADLDCQLGPGIRLGVLGPNGGGKSSLLAALTGELALTAGRVKRAHDLRIATFDQTRSALDRDSTLRLALAPNGKSVEFRGRSQHVNAWASRFLFSTDRLEQRVGSLSGGEQARLLIAQLMLRPADILLLDEPTNDLDIPALEVLEDSLLDFPGAVALVTHDRFLLDRVCTDFVSINGDGSWRRVGSYRQWQDQQSQQPAAGVPSSPTAAAQPSSSPAASATALSYAEQKELRGIEGRIAKAEARVAALVEEMADPAVYSNASKLAQLQTKHDAEQATVDQLYARWEELEAKAG
ncbi:MAG: ABC-F family ATP-binding cassette domain-containing protein [Planctomycetota bacterium]|jgi:ATP-binding cassette subfamily F protein uup